MTLVETVLDMPSVLWKNNKIAFVLTSTGGNQALTLTPTFLRPVFPSIISELLKIIEFLAGSELLTSPLTNFFLAAHGSQNF